MFEVSLTGKRVLRHLGAVLRLFLIGLGVALLVHGLVVSAQKLIQESRTQQELQREAEPETHPAPASPRPQNRRTSVISVANV